MMNGKSMKRRSSLALCILLTMTPCVRAQFDRPSSPEPAIRERRATESGNAPAESSTSQEYELPENDKIDWSRVRGVNYLPAYAASPYHMWRHYNPDIIRLDLARAHQIGFNSLRVFLSFLAYEAKPSEFVTNWQDFMQAAQAEGVTIMPVLFDSWGVETERDYSVDAQLGAADAKTRYETTKTAYDKFVSRPDAYTLNVKMYERMMRVIAEVATPERPVPISTDPSVTLWGDWAPSPGPSRVTGKALEKCTGYAKAVMEPFKTSSFIAAWDIMNEPDSIRVFSPNKESDAVYEFVGHMIKVAREVAPFQPLTVGASGTWDGARVFAKKIDVVSFHAIQESAADLGAGVRQAQIRQFPYVVTACGAIMFPAKDSDITPESQVRQIRETLQIMRQQHCGFYLWHLVEGKGVTPWCGILNANGTPKPAADMLKKEFASSRK